MPNPPHRIVHFVKIFDVKVVRLVVATDSEGRSGFFRPESPVAVAATEVGELQRLLHNVDARKMTKVPPDGRRDVWRPRVMLRLLLQGVHTARDDEATSLGMRVCDR